MGDGRTNVSIFPRRLFLTAAVGFAMVAPAQRHDELITRFAA
jgi:hypothetical protein